MQKRGLPGKIIAGNNDFFCDLPKEEEFLIGSYQVWLTHGHNYYVSMGNEILKEESGSQGGGYRYVWAYP